MQQPTHLARQRNTGRRLLQACKHKALLSGMDGGWRWMEGLRWDWEMITGVRVEGLGRQASQTL